MKIGEARLIGTDNHVIITVSSDIVIGPTPWPMFPPPGPPGPPPPMPGPIIMQGIQGTQGIQGIQGIQGVQGMIGHMGLQGIQGTQGKDGLQGIQGIQGIQGQKGESFSPDMVHQVEFEFNGDSMEFVHNLGWYPVINVYKVIDNELIEVIVDVVQIDKTKFRIDFNESQSGMGIILYR